MPNYIRVKQIDQPELTGFFVDSISSQSGLLINITSGFVSKLVKEETEAVVYATGNQTISGVKTFNLQPILSGNPLITGVDLTSYITTSQTGNFYAKSNPSGFITGVDLSSYITTSQTGNFYSTSNPSGFITGISNIVYNTGDQTISGNKSFVNKIYLNNENNEEIGGTSLQGNVSGISLNTFQNPTDIKIKTDFVGGHNEEVISIHNNYYTDAIFGKSINTDQYQGDQIVIYQTGSAYGVPSSKGPYIRLGENNIISEKNTSKLGIGTLSPTEKVHISGGNLKIEGDAIANNLVYNTGDQNISGIKSFYSRPTVNGTGLLLSGEAASLPETIVYTTGDQTISGTKTFAETGSFNTLLIKNKILSSYNYATSNFTFNNNYINLINAPNNVTGTLPSEITSGINYYVKNLNTGRLTITGDANKSIDGFSTVHLYQNESLQLFGVNSVGYTGWVTISSDVGVS
jgi:hypothetical protein